MKMTLYLDNARIHRQIKQAASDFQVSLSAYCPEAVRERLRKDGYLRSKKEKLKTAREMDTLRKEIGPTGTPVRELIEEGRC